MSIKSQESTQTHKSGINHKVQLSPVQRWARETDSRIFHFVTYQTQIVTGRSEREQMYCVWAADVLWTWRDVVGRIQTSALSNKRLFRGSVPGGHRYIFGCWYLLFCFFCVYSSTFRGPALGLLFCLSVVNVCACVRRVSVSFAPSLQNGLFCTLFE